MSVRRDRMMAAACLAVALLAGAAAAVGVFARGTGATAEATSIRGERFEYATDGVYAYNAERVVAEGVGWDAATLVLAAPALLISAVAIARGSLRARLFAAGVLGCLTYQYLMYSVFWALGPLFPVFVVLYPASFATLVWIVSSVDVRQLASRLDGRFPRRGIAAFCAAMAVLLVGMWSARIARGLAGDVAGAQLLGTPTLAVQALDLGIVVPLCVATAALVLARRPAGYLLGALLPVKGALMAAAICAMLVSAWIVEGRAEIAPLAVFAAATIAAAALAVRALSGLARAEAAGAGALKA
ncbi:MAG: hypothetical protein QMD96_04580 [Anaerosomatales bacterium]|nr:hypothetical protein [Anaerosomatales bacterium]